MYKYKETKKLTDFKTFPEGFFNTTLQLEGVVGRTYTTAEAIWQTADSIFSGNTSLPDKTINCCTCSSAIMVVL